MYILFFLVSTTTLFDSAVAFAAVPLSLLIAVAEASLVEVGVFEEMQLEGYFLIHLH